MIAACGQPGGFHALLEENMDRKRLFAYIAGTVD